MPSYVSQYTGNRIAPIPPGMLEMFAQQQAQQVETMRQAGKSLGAGIAGAIQQYKDNKDQTDYVNTQMEGLASQLPSSIDMSGSMEPDSQEGKIAGLIAKFPTMNLKQKQGAFMAASQYLDNKSKTDQQQFQNQQSQQMMAYRGNEDSRRQAEFQQQQDVTTQTPQFFQDVQDYMNGAPPPDERAAIGQEPVTVGGVKRNMMDAFLMAAPANQAAAQHYLSPQLLDQFARNDQHANGASAITSFDKSPNGKYFARLGNTILPVPDTVPESPQIQEIDGRKFINLNGKGLTELKDPNMDATEGTLRNNNTAIERQIDDMIKVKGQYGDPGGEISQRILELRKEAADLKNRISRPSKADTNAKQPEASNRVKVISPYGDIGYLDAGVDLPKGWKLRK